MDEKLKEKCKLKYSEKRGVGTGKERRGVGNSERK